MSVIKLTAICHVCKRSENVEIQYLKDELVELPSYSCPCRYPQWMPTPCEVRYVIDPDGKPNE